MRSILAISLIPVSMLMALTEASTVVSVDVVRAIDGDTLVVTVDDSLRKLRRLGIDAPEYDPDGGNVCRSSRLANSLLTLNRAKCRAVLL